MQELREETTELRVDREEMICREAHVERFEDDLERVCEEHGWWHAHYNELQVTLKVHNSETDGSKDFYGEIESFVSFIFPTVDGQRGSQWLRHTW